MKMKWQGPPGINVVPGFWGQAVSTTVPVYDSETGKVVVNTWGKATGIHTPVSLFGPENTIDSILGAMLFSAVHEVMEWFSCENVRVFDAHHSALSLPVIMRCKQLAELMVKSLPKAQSGAPRPRVKRVSGIQTRKGKR